MHVLDDMLEFVRTGAKKHQLAITAKARSDVASGARLAQSCVFKCLLRPVANDGGQEGVGATHVAKNPSCKRALQRACTTLAHERDRTM